MARSLLQYGDGGAGRAGASQDGDFLSNDLDRAFLQRQDEMSQPSEAGGVMARVDAVLPFEVADPRALLNRACPRQPGKPTPVQAMTGPSFVAGRPHKGSLGAGPDEDDTVLVGVINVRIERQHCMAAVTDG